MPETNTLISAATVRIKRFKLVQFFTLASFGMFVVVAAALVYFQNQQTDFFADVQARQIRFFAEVQELFAAQQDEVARRDLLAIHESGNVNLTRLFANALWEKDFAPFVQEVQAIPVEHCHAMPDQAEGDGERVAPAGRKECFAEIGRQIMALPAFHELDLKVFQSMKSSTVYKIKVFDLRGITVYSSEHAQVGQDKRSNAGWRGAALEGKSNSELTHRDRFSAFEGVVENRDVISSYLPVREPGSDRIVGAFEIYSDVTRFLEQINRTANLIKQTASDNMRQVEGVAAAQQTQVEQSSRLLTAIILGLLGVLFVALYLLVRRADRIIVHQASERERVQQQLAQSEKMAFLGQMVAGVAHQLNTPLAFSYNNVSMVQQALKEFDVPLEVTGIVQRAAAASRNDQVTLDVTRLRPLFAGRAQPEADTGMLQDMLEDTLKGIQQMRELVENLRDFTRLDRSKISEFDLNQGLRNVIYMARSVIPTTINVEEHFGSLPLISCNPGQLNQVFLSLINNAAQAIGDAGTVRVTSRLEGDAIRIDIADDGAGIADDVLPHIFETYFTTKARTQGTGLGLPIARTIVEEHGGRIEVATEVGKGSTFTVFLPIGAAAQAA